MARLQRKRPVADDYAAFPYERRFRDDDDRALRFGFDGGQPKVFRLALLADYFRLQNNFIRLGGDNAFDAVAKEFRIQNSRFKVKSKIQNPKSKIRNASFRNVRFCASSRRSFAEI